MAVTVEVYIMVMMKLLFLLLLMAPILVAAQGELTVEIHTPVDAVVKVGKPLAQPMRLRATVVVPSSAPTDLTLRSFVADERHQWYVSDASALLQPGIQTVDFSIALDALWYAVDHAHPWNTVAWERLQTVGLTVTSPSNWRGSIQIDYILEPLLLAPSAPTPTQAALYDITWSAAQAHTGQRWYCTFQPWPLPGNPYDPAQFQAWLEVSYPGWDSPRRYRAFYDQPMVLTNRGDREVAAELELGKFVCRWRPQQSGIYDLTLIAQWLHGQEHVFTQQSLEVFGEDWDDYVRVSTKDPRFLVANGKIYWPIGINIRSANDLRSQKRMLTKVTPDLGLETYQAYIRRLAACGVNCIEVWMSSWNLALEWCADWPNYQGLGRYNQVHANRFDRLLDFAWSHGVRINVVVYNHGMASTKNDREWNYNPMGKHQGGFLNHAREVFTDPMAWVYQSRLRHYLIARYADHPAILGWKLWSEQNLTAGKKNDRVLWHQKAAADWLRYDHYDHPVTTHWAGDYRSVDREIASQHNIGYITVNAYHDHQKRERDQTKTSWTLLANQVYETLNNKRRGLQLFGKPVLITEYGGSFAGGKAAQILAEQRSGPWAALVSGLAGSPMLWWFEWVDQNEYFEAYEAIRSFIKGEDWRNPDARSVPLSMQTQHKTWAYAWQGDTRAFGYILNYEWGLEGGIQPWHRSDILQKFPKWETGEIEWWDANSGRLIKTEKFDQAISELTVPSFSGHIAFKMRRVVAK